MAGFGLALLLVLALAGTLVSLWLTCTNDQRRLHNKRLAYRRSWLRDWRDYKRNNPRASSAEYIKRFKETKPVNMPYHKQRSTEKLFLVTALGFAILEAFLLYKAFHYWHHHNQPAYGILCFYTGFAVIVALVWCYLLFEVPQVLPSYARSGRHYRDDLPPLPED